MRTFRRVLQPMMLAAAAASSSLSTEARAWQVDDVRVDGVPLSIRSGDFSVARPRIAEGLLARWEGSGAAAPIITAGDGRTVIGRQRGPLHEAVTLTDVGPARTRIVVTVRDLRIRASAPARPPAGLPNGMRTLRVVEHLGRADGARTFSFDLDKPPSQALERWRRSMAITGWQVRVMDSVGRDPQLGVLWATRGRERLEAVFGPGASGTRIVMQVSRDVATRSGQRGVRGDREQLGRRSLPAVDRWRLAGGLVARGRPGCGSGDADVVGGALKHGRFG
jgi:hypothetical protein